MVGLRCLGGGLRLPEGFLAAEPIPKTSSLVFGALDVAVGQGKNVFQPQNKAQVVPPMLPWPERLRAVSQLGPLEMCPVARTSGTLRCWGCCSAPQNLKEWLLLPT